MNADCTPHREFRWATPEEIAVAVALKVNMIKFAQVDGWCEGYFLETTHQPYFFDTTLDKWVVPEGNWEAIAPLLLAADAKQWIEEQT